MNPLFRSRILLSRWQAALPARVLGAVLPAGAVDLVPQWASPPTADERAIADTITAEVLATFPAALITDGQWSAWEAGESDREIDAVPDAIVDLILAAKARPPTATAEDVRERAKADRRGRLGTRDAGGRP